MIAVAAWGVLAASVLAFELVSRRTPKVASLTRIGASIARSRTGMVLMLAAWAFVGVHLFARHTVPQW